MLRRTFLTALSSLPFLSILKPTDEKVDTISASWDDCPSADIIKNIEKLKRKIISDTGLNPKPPVVFVAEQVSTEKINEILSQGVEVIQLLPGRKSITYIPLP